MVLAPSERLTSFVQPNEVISHGLGTPVMSSHVEPRTSWSCNGVYSAVVRFCVCMSGAAGCCARWPVRGRPLSVSVCQRRRCCFTSRCRCARRADCGSPAPTQACRQATEEVVHKTETAPHHSMLGVKPPAHAEGKRGRFSTAKVLIHGFSPRNH